MKMSACFECKLFPCSDMDHAGYWKPEIDLEPAAVTRMMISECAPAQPGDGYYAGGEALFVRTTLLAFEDAGIKAARLPDLVAMGIYFTAAVKCAKTGYGILPATVDECSRLLEKELALFPNLRVLWLMGDVAIRAVNQIAKRAGEPRVIPAGSTYKLRGSMYTFRQARAFPSYLQAGPSFFIEKSKRKMIAEDIAAGMKL